jgi:hypothetical protein
VPESSEAGLEMGHHPNNSQIASKTATKNIKCAATDLLTKIIRN